MMLTFLNFTAFLLVTGYSLYLFAHVVYSRYTFITLGKKSNLHVDLKERINSLIVDVFGQRKLLKDKKSGYMHIVMFYGFIILQFGAVELIIKGFLRGFELPLGTFHPHFSLFQEVTVVLVLLSVIFAYYRRYVERLPRLKRGFKAGVVIFFIGSLMLSIFFSLAFETLMMGHTPNLVFQPFSGLISNAFLGISVTTATLCFYVFWWFHLIVLLSFMVYLPQSKHAHILFAPINIFFRRAEHPGQLKSINFADESQEEFGVGCIEGFRQEQLIDLYACVECGRCTNMCPASGTGKTLSPMDLIVKMRDHLTEKGAAITARTPWMPSFAFNQPFAISNLLEEAAAAMEGSAVLERQLIGDVISEQELWACTTCRNCEDQCPVMNEHVDKIIDMRRFLVLTEGKMPAEAARTLQNIERQSNPWGINRKERINWRQGLEDIVKTVAEVDSFDILLWVGSMGSFDNRSQKIVRSFAKIMYNAGVRFAILGNEERNSGDTARRMGNEFLFQQLCTENIDTFKKYNVKKIVTICPHTFNTFKNEYPEYGLEAELLHHTQFLYQLIMEGKIKPEHEVKERIVYHDSCYLGRYNNIFDVPRNILREIPGIELVEMKRMREDALCCGAGGGMMWMEETEGTRVNLARTEMALAAKPSVIGSNCPYCLTMMSDGTKAKEVEDQVKTLDIVEILEQSLPLI